MKRILSLIVAVVLMLASLQGALAEFEPLQKGSKGAQVKRVQSILKAQGYLSGSADGDFGGGTEKAVIAFQEANGLEATGIVDEATYALLIPPIDLSLVDRVTLSAGSDHVLGLKEDGTVFALQTNKNARKDWGQYDVEDWTDVVSVCAGAYHSLGLRADGTVLSAGDNDDGQCNVQGWTGIIDIASKDTHTVGLRADGTVIAAGSNENGRCNVGGWTDIVDVEAGISHTLGLRADGTVVAVGDNDCGQCNVSSWTDIVAIEGGFDCSIGLKSDGTIVCAGGKGEYKNNLYTAEQWRNVVSVCANDYKCKLLAVCADGTIADKSMQASKLPEEGKKVAAAVINFFGDWPVYLYEDGTVYSRLEGFEGVVLQTPDVRAVDAQSVPTGDMGVWKLRAYVDEFDLPTDQYYISSKTAFTGKFSNSAVNNAELNAYLFVDYDKYGPSLDIRLLEYGDHRVNNPYSKSKGYDITVMDPAGNKYNIEGSMFSESSDIYVCNESAQIIIDALHQDGTVRFSIAPEDNNLTRYIFTVEDSTGFDVAYYRLREGLIDDAEFEQAQSVPAPAEEETGVEPAQSGTESASAQTAPENVQFTPESADARGLSFDDWYTDVNSAILSVLLMQDQGMIDDFVARGDKGNVYIGKYGTDCLTLLVGMGEGEMAMLNYLPAARVALCQAGLIFTLDADLAANLYGQMGVTEYKQIPADYLDLALAMR